MSQNKFLITQSLISSWLWSYKLEDGYDDFLSTLKREPQQQTTAIRDGIIFENCLNEVLKGAEIPDTHEWHKPIKQMARYLADSQQQVALSKDITVDGIDFVLYGILDYLRCGIIFDCKFSKTYSVGKYLTSPQTSAYFELVPEAYEFQYIICDGKYVYREKYRRDEVEPITKTIHQFIEFLKRYGLLDTYKEHWKSKY